MMNDLGVGFADGFKIRAQRALLNYSFFIIHQKSCIA